MRCAMKTIALQLRLQQQRVLTQVPSLSSLKLSNHSKVGNIECKGGEDEEQKCEREVDGHEVPFRSKAPWGADAACCRAAESLGVAHPFEGHTTGRCRDYLLW